MFKNLFYFMMLFVVPNLLSMECARPDTSKEFGEENCLLDALRDGDKETAKFLISIGVDVNVSNAQECTPLMFACTHQNFSDIVRLLINNGAAVNVENLYGETALMFANCVGDQATIELLIKAGARTNSKDKPNITFAGKKTGEIIVEPLQEEQSITYNTYPVRQESESTLAEYIKQKSFEGNDLLNAIKTGDIEMVEVLLATGADVNVKTAEGQTSMLYVGKLNQVLVIS